MPEGKNNKHEITRKNAAFWGVAPCESCENRRFEGTCLRNVLECASRKVQENHVGLKLNWTSHLLDCADDVNLLGDNIDTIKKNTETSIDASNEVHLEIKVGKTKYICCLFTRM
jgi:hypothetical protein